MVQSFRARRSNLRMGASWLAFCLFFIVVGGIGVFLENADRLPMGRRLTQSLGCSALWLPFAALAAWMILDYRRTRVLVGQKSLVVRGVLRMRRVAYRDIIRAKWSPRRVLRVWTSRGRVSLEVSGITSSQQERLMRLLHERISRDTQIGWEAIPPAGLQNEADPQYFKTLFHRTVRLAIIGPIAGVILGIVCHFVYGYHPQIGLTGNLILTGALAGLAGGVVVVLLMAWMCWVEKPD